MYYHIFFMYRYWITYILRINKNFNTWFFHKTKQIQQCAFFETCFLTLGSPGKHLLREVNLKFILYILEVAIPLWGLVRAIRRALTWASVLCGLVPEWTISVEPSLLPGCPHKNVLRICTSLNNIWYDVPIYYFAHLLHCFIYFHTVINNEAKKALKLQM